MATDPRGITSAPCIALMIGLVSMATASQATDCSTWPRFSSDLPYLEPLSVDISDVGTFFSTYEYSGGVQFSSKMHGEELWIDITKFPGDTTAAAATRMIMQVGRLVDDDFSVLVLNDGDVGLFAVPEPALRNIGCQFIWGVVGGQNPIALMRELYKVMEHYETRQPLSTRWNGSLLGDSTLAVSINNDLLIPKWVLSAVQ